MGKKMDLLDFLGWRSPVERISESDRLAGKTNFTFDEEYDTYFNQDVQTELQTSGGSKATSWTQMKKRARYYVPIFMWLPRYNFKAQFPRDLVAGLACGAMLIPQSLAYATLAGLPPVMGLHTAWMPLIVYFFLGTSKQLSIGPDALSSILVGLLLTEGGHEDPAQAAHFVAFIAGMFLFCAGILRLGFLDNILSRPMLSGFVNAVAIFIVCDQFDTFFGLPSAAKLGKHGPEKVVYFFENIGLVKWNTFILGLIAASFLFAFRIARQKLGKRYPFLKFVPEILLLVIAGIILSVSIDLTDPTIDIPILGDLDAKFPVPAVPDFTPTVSHWRTGFTDGLIIGIIGFVESIVVAKIYAAKHNYFVSPNRELVAFGMANMMGSFFGTYPTFGSLPRSSVADIMGATSQMFTLIASCVILFTTLFLGPIFYFLPKVVMSAVIVVAAYGLLEFEDIVFVWRMKGWKDLAIMLLTFFITLFASVELGILVGLGISMLLLVKNNTRLHISLYGHIPGTTKYKKLDKHPEAQRIEDITILSLTDSLFFSNIQKAKDMISRIEKLGSHVIHPGEDLLTTELKGVVLIAKNISEMDVSAVQVIHEMVESYHARHIPFTFVELPDQFRKIFKEAGIFHHVPECDALFDNVHAAVDHIRQHSQESHGKVDTFQLEESEAGLVYRTTRAKQNMQKDMETKVLTGLRLKKKAEDNEEQLERPKRGRRPSILEDVDTHSTPSSPVPLEEVHMDDIVIIDH